VTLALVLRFALSIVLDALAFIVWDVGTRPPLRLWGDAFGMLRFIFGAALLFAAADVARPGMPTMRAFTFIETGMLVAALLVEQLVGPDLRRQLRG
jgi:hypothetical protein